MKRIERQRRYVEALEDANQAHPGMYEAELEEARQRLRSMGPWRPSRILVMISYDIDVGFAIGRLIAAFHQMALRVTELPCRVHFSFGKIGSKRSMALPADFDNLLQFNYREHSAADEERLVEYIADNAIDTIFALDMRVDAPCLKAARRAGVRRVVSYWGASMSSITWKWPLKRLQVALTRAKPDLFVFESEAMRRLAVRGRGVARSSTAIVRTGVDVGTFQPGATEVVYERFSIPPDRRIIVFVGHVQRRKGVHVLLAAAEHIVSTYGRKDIHFLCLGNRDGEAREFDAFYNKAREYVTFGGYQADVPALLSGCYAGCIPSTGWDSYPMSSLEMQACGLPVIVSDCQGCPETISEDTGMVVPAGDERRLAQAILLLVDNRARREMMSVAAAERIRSSLTVEHQVANLTRLLSGGVDD
jgi:glycosyltransferase involved in cell wall biosynthesis